MRCNRTLNALIRQTKSLSRYNYNINKQLTPCLSHYSKHQIHTHHRRFCTSQSSDDTQTKEEINAEFDDIDLSDVTTEEVKVQMNEVISPNDAKQHTFQAETKQLLDIVSRSLYTDKEVFVRELLSNASDALEKCRYNINKNSSDIMTPEIPLEIEVFTDKEKGQIIIQDSGIGMNEEELIDNIGTIARSGSRAFVGSLSGDQSKGDSIIGQFGVGFYSVFMVSDFVEVYSQSAYSDSSNGYYWHSDGTGSYSISSATNVQRGSKIIVNLRDDLKTEYSDKYRIEEIIRKYSSYLSYPIKLNGSLITSSGGIWSRMPKEVTDSEHESFYQLIANRYDSSYYTYHAHIDSSRFSAQVLMYFPGTHSEKFGATRMDPQMSIYCKKVLVSKNAKEIIPDWLRFVVGCVDCENIPIHISRETMQDSELIKQLKETMMLKCVDFLKKEMKKDIAKYAKWYSEFAGFVKEGVCTDYPNRSRIAQLLMYSTNKTEGNDKISLEDYVTRMDSEKQKEIYYLIAPNKQSAMNSPYMEAFVDSDIEVLFCYAQIDEFVIKNLGSFKSFDFVGCETSTSVPEQTDTNDTANALDESQVRRLSKWMKSTFPMHLSKVESTHRLNKHPSVLVDHQSSAIRHYLHALNENVNTPPQRMQINPKHAIIIGLYKMIESDQETNATVIARQMINNSFIAAGILDDPKEMLNDINLVMQMALDSTLDLDLKNHDSQAKPNEGDQKMDQEKEILEQMQRDLDNAGIKYDRNESIDGIDDVEFVDSNDNKHSSNQ